MICRKIDWIESHKMNSIFQRKDKVIVQRKYLDFLKAPTVSKISALIKVNTVQNVLSLSDIAEYTDYRTVFFFLSSRYMVSFSHSIVYSSKGTWDYTNDSFE